MAKIKPKTKLSLLKTHDRSWTADQENIASIDRLPPSGTEIEYSYWVEYTNGAKVRVETAQVVDWVKQRVKKVTKPKVQKFSPQLDISLRDYFAGQALAGILTDDTAVGEYAHFAKTAYEYADAMLKHRSEPPEDG